MQLDFSTNQIRAVRSVYYSKAAITLPEPLIITLDRDDYCDITAQLAGAKAQGKLGERG